MFCFLSFHQTAVVAAAYVVERVGVTVGVTVQVARWVEIDDVGLGQGAVIGQRLALRSTVSIPPV